jgi:acetyl-CoA synthetase
MSVEEFKYARDYLLALRDNYPLAKARFAWPKLSRFNWALDWFDGELAQGAEGERPALRIVGDEVEVYSFAELSEASSRVANGLRALGARRGDRLLLALGEVAPLWIASLAAIKLGLVVIPAPAQLSAADVDDRFARGRIGFVLAEAAEAGRFADRGDGAIRIAVGQPTPPGWRDWAELTRYGAHFEPDGPTRPNDPLLVYFTSGSTALPQLVVHSHASYPVGHLSTMFALGLKPSDRHLDVSSPGWAKHAWSSFFAPWNAGACVVALAGRFDPRATLDALAAHAIDSFCAPPTVWRQLVRLDLGRWNVALREVCSSGEPLGADLIDAVLSGWGLTLRDCYGQTETTMMVGNPPGQKVASGAMGRALPGYRVVLLDVEGLESDVGEIALPLAPRPLGLMRGYQGEDGEPAPIEADYYRTGDLASRDAEGYFTFVGRVDELFKSSDYRVSPFELESALLEHPAVAEAAVTAAPDPIRLAVPKAYVTLAEGHAPDRETARSIFAFLSSRLAPYKRVRRIEFGALPKTLSGKIRRVELRARERELAEVRARAAGEFRLEDFPKLG